MEKPLVDQLHFGNMKEATLERKAVSVNKAGKPSDIFKVWKHMKGLP